MLEFWAIVTIMILAFGFDYLGRRLAEINETLKKVIEDDPA